MATLCAFAEVTVKKQIAKCFARRFAYIVRTKKLQSVSP